MQTIRQVKLCSFLGMLLAVSACSHLPSQEPSVVTRTKTVVITTPDALLKKCPVTPPPKDEDYLSPIEEKDTLEAIVVEFAKRQRILSDYAINLIRDMHQCNIQLEKAREFQRKQNQLYSQ